MATYVAEIMMANRSKILVIDDEPLMRVSIVDALIEEQYEVLGVDSGRIALNLLDTETFDVIITDLKLPEVDGIEILNAAIRLSPKVKVIMITAHGSVDTAVEAMKQGAYDYITKPFSMDELLIVVRRLVELRRLENENLRLREKVDEKYVFEGVIGNCGKMQGVFDKVKAVAETGATVLITGESGTGKELIANAIHNNSSRKNRPFIKVSCAALPETLLETELFGHEKGAFTGAIKQKKGRFELAEGGTLFLDEIGEISPVIQVKLLRVLQIRQFERIGGTETLNADVRIICATQRDLKKEVQKGAFREDLYYRLNVVPVHIPPLRERKEDIMLMAHNFLKKFNTQNGKHMEGISSRAMEFLLHYQYPGNIRELEHAIERAVILGRGREIEPSDLPEEMLPPGTDMTGTAFKYAGTDPLSSAMEHFEKGYITQALEMTKGNKTLAAERLGISRKNLWEKCKYYGLGAKDQEQ